MKPFEPGGLRWAIFYFAKQYSDRVIVRRMSYKRKRIGLLIETSTSFGRGLLRGISEYTRKNGDWALLLEPTGFDDSFRNLDRWALDGMLVRVHKRDLVDLVIDSGIPVIDLGYVIPDLFPWSIANDHLAIGQLAGEHLGSRGYRNFAFCGWGPANPWTAEWEKLRLAGFREAVSEWSTEVAVYQWPETADWHTCQNHLATWIESLPTPLGLFACNDHRAREVVSALEGSSRRIPEEVALLGVDNDLLLDEVIVPSLSSIAPDFVTFGYRGAEMLDRLMQGKLNRQTRIRIPPLGVVARESTDVLATSDTAIVAATAFIRAHLGDLIAVDDVARHTGISRRSLEKKFRAELQRTPSAEIRRLRLNRARDMLTFSDDAVKQIAGECGFHHLESFHRAFKERFGLTPGQYRREYRRHL